MDRKKQMITLFVVAMIIGTAMAMIILPKLSQTAPKDKIPPSVQIPPSSAQPFEADR